MMKDFFIQSNLNNLKCQGPQEFFLNIHTGWGQSKMPILSRNVHPKSIETVFLIAICRNSGDKWQSKTLFLSIFYPCSTIVDSVFGCRLPDVILVDQIFEIGSFRICLDL